MATGEVTLFPDLATIVWTLVNLFIVLAIAGGLVLGVRFFVRLNRRVRRIEERLKLEAKQE